jgi:hypothetical protein
MLWAAAVMYVRGDTARHARQFISYFAGECSRLDCAEHCQGVKYMYGSCVSLCITQQQTPVHTTMLRAAVVMYVRGDTARHARCAFPSQHLPLSS